MEDPPPFEEDNRITGRYKEFALEVQRILGLISPNSPTLFSTRMAEGKTGISYGTISTMARGHRPKAETIIRFAERMPGANVVLLLSLAGHSEREITRLLKDAGHHDVDLSVLRQVTRETLLEDARVAARSGEISVADAEEIAKILERRRKAQE
jgi:hypothetical protein